MRNHKTWQEHEAQTRFSELLDRCEADGPQIVTRRGVETAVVVPYDQWAQERAQLTPNAKDVLLNPRFRGEIPLPSRRGFIARLVPDLFTER